MTADSLQAVDIDEPLNHDSPQQLWVQAAGALRRDIQAGRLTGRVPGQLQLAERFGVSRQTVRQALAALAADGLVVTTPKKGTFVVPQQRGSSGTWVTRKEDDHNAQPPQPPGTDAT